MNLLAASATIYPFDQTLPTELLTDASNVHGIGYVLLQVRPELEEGSGQRRNMIRCGSRSLTGPESRYAIIELEAVEKCAVEKCAYFLQGCSLFSVITDHCPLVGIWQKDIVDVNSILLSRIMERLQGYLFKVKGWQGDSTTLQTPYQELLYSAPPKRTWTRTSTHMSATSPQRGQQKTHRCSPYSTQQQARHTRSL